MPHWSYTFSHAITRRPAPSVIDGLRAVDNGTPDFTQMCDDHDHYCATLRDTGAEVVVLEPLNDFPDAQFVEDTALCLPEVAVLMRPGAVSRRGEVDHMTETLNTLYSEVRRIDAKGNNDGYIEGGDILVTGREILVGRSDRTDANGVATLKVLLSDWNYNVTEVFTPPDVLHFKTDCSLLDEETILTTRRLAASGCFDGYRLIYTADGEEAAANAIRFNELLLMPSGHPDTAQELRQHGFDVREINNAECAKIDGGMSCLSLRMTPKKSTP